MIDLGAPQPITLVVLRGCAFDCGLDMSLDGEHWIEIGNGRDALLRADADGATGRYIRARASLFFLAELSVWSS